MARKSKEAIELPVEFGGVSIGKSTARLGVVLSRDKIGLSDADDLFCGHRLTGTIVLGAKDGLTQGKLIEDADVGDETHEVSGTFDVKRIGANAEEISTGLTFSLSDVDISELAKFSKGTGRLIVREVNELPDDAADDSDDEAPEAKRPAPVRATGPWRKVKLDELFSGGILKALNEADLKTVGQLSDYTASDKRLTDLDGIGPGKAANIEERMLEFWASNPQYCDGAAGGEE